MRTVHGFLAPLVLIQGVEDVIDLVGGDRVHVRDPASGVSVHQNDERPAGVGVGKTADGE